MKHYFFLIALAIAACSAGAQGNFYTYAFSVDTLTNTDNSGTAFTLPITLRDAADYSFQINATQISGTTAATAYVQVSDDGGTTWATLSFPPEVVLRDTVTFAGTANALLVGSTISPRVRVFVSQTGTSVTKYQVYAVLRRKN